MTKHTPEFTQPQLPFDEIPYGYCHCGCGQKTTIPTKTSTLHKRIKGVPVRFIAGHHQKLSQKRPLAQRFWEKVDKRGPDDCWEWQAALTEDGYGNFKVGSMIDGTLDAIKAHRVAYTLQYGPIEDGLHCLHKCDNSKCVNPSHLYLGTHQDNMDDRKQRNRHASLPGEANPNAKLSANDVAEIRRLYASGVKPKALARQMNVTETNIRAIVEYKIWQHI